ncbi:MAG: rod-binding protein [Phycisphaerae bacterium]
MSQIGTINPSSVAEPPAKRLNELREVAGKVVGSVFYGKLLQTMRDSTLKGEYGHGGRGEEIFQAQMDQFLAEEAGRSKGFDLAEAIYQRFAGRVRARGHASAEQESAT